MKKSRHETLLKLILPALLVIFGYFIAAPYLLGSWGTVINPQKTLSDLETRVQNERARAPSPAALAQEQAQLEDAQDLSVELRQAQAAVQLRWQSLTGGRSASSRRLDVLAGVGQLLKDHGLRTLEQGPVEGDAAKVPLPASLQAALEEMTGPKGDGQGQMVRFKFVGRYLAVRLALQELATRSWTAFPVGLTMEETDVDRAERTWTLVVWI